MLYNALLKGKNTQIKKVNAYNIEVVLRTSSEEYKVWCGQDVSALTPLSSLVLVAALLAVYTFCYFSPISIRNEISCYVQRLFWQYSQCSMDNIMMS